MSDIIKTSSSIQEIIKDAKKGKMFILDNKDRENEGDLVVPAAKASPKINFMAKHGKRFNMFSFNIK